MRAAPFWFVLGLCGVLGCHDSEPPTQKQDASSQLAEDAAYIGGDSEPDADVTDADAGGSTSAGDADTTSSAGDADSAEADDSGMDARAVEDGGSSAPIDAAADDAHASAEPDATSTPPLDAGTPCATDGGVDDLLLDIPRSEGNGRGALSSTRYAAFGDRHWTLWDLSTHQRISQGAADCPKTRSPCGTLREGLLLLVQPMRISVRDALNGQERGGVPFDASSRYGAARDGSYFWTADATALRFWSNAAVALGQVSGDYSAAAISAEPGLVRIAKGPAGPQVIASVAVPSLDQSVSAEFEGVFEAWFSDGNRFATSNGRIISIYSSAVVREEMQELIQREEGTVGGKGDYYWLQVSRSQTPASGPQYNIYRVGNGSSVVGTQSGSFGVMLSLGPFAFSPSSNRVTITDYGGTSRTVRTDDGSAVGVAFNERGDVAVESSTGVIHYFRGGDEVAKLGLGTVADMDLSANGRWAASFSAGQVLIGDVGARTITTTIDLNAERPSDANLSNYFPRWTKFSPDAGLIAILVVDHRQLAPYDRTSVRLYDVTTGSKLREWPCLDDEYSNWKSFSLSSERIARHVLDGADSASVVSDLDGVQADVSISPQGSAMFLPPTGAGLVVGDYYSATTTFYDAQGALGWTLAGYPLAWLDDNRLLVETLTGDEPNAVMIVDPQSMSMASTALPAASFHGSVYQGLSYVFRPLRGGTLLFWNDEVRGGIFDLTHEEPRWRTPLNAKLPIANDTYVTYYDSAQSALCRATPEL